MIRERLFDNVEVCYFNEREMWVDIILPTGEIIRKFPVEYLLLECEGVDGYEEIRREVGEFEKSNSQNPHITMREFARALGYNAGDNQPDCPVDRPVPAPTNPSTDNNCPSQPVHFWEDVVPPLHWHNNSVLEEPDNIEMIITGDRAGRLDEPERNDEDEAHE